MEAERNAVNRAFEAVGSQIRGYVEDGTLVVRDLVVFDLGNGSVGAFEVSDMDSPVFRLPADATSTIAGAVVMHVLKRIVANAIDD